MGELVVAVAEVARLHPAFLDEGVDAVVDLAQAHTQLAGEFPLAEVGARVEQAQEAVVGFFHRGSCVQRVNEDCPHGAGGCQGGGDLRAPLEIGVDALFMRLLGRIRIRSAPVVGLRFMEHSCQGEPLPFRESAKRE